MARFRKFLTTVALFSCSGVFGFSQSIVRSRIVQPIDDSQMTQLHGTVNPVLQRAVDQGRVNSAMKLNGVSIYFDRSPNQKIALQQLISEQQNPSSPNYHQWLSPEQFADRFGMSIDDINKVTSWLKQHGFTVNEVSRSRDRVSFSGNIRQIETTFHTQFHQYLVSGEKHFANASELSVPAAFASAVITIQNLNDFRLKPKVRAVPHFTSSISGNHFLVPADIATIYDINSLYTAGIDGTGLTIAVAGQSLINPQDIANFRNAAGLPSNPPVLVLMPNTGAAATSLGDEVESDLDVEWSGAIAKNAKIIFVFVGSNQNVGVFDAFSYAIENKIAPIVSMSYGACELSNGGLTFVNMVEAETAKAISFGETVTAAAGDAGATDCESANATIATQGISVDVPASLPEVTGVGGTTLNGDTTTPSDFWNAANDPNTSGSAIKYIPETTWNDTFGSATGGGVSIFVNKPSYQMALTPADGHRDVPDVALAASPNHDGYLICDADNSTANKGGLCNNGFRDTSTNNLFPAGGTSFGAPEFAGIVALADQITENSAGAGNVNPILYTLAASTPSAFHDITTGDNKQTCQGGSTGCTAGNSHNEISEKRSGLPAYAALFLLPLGAVFMYKGRRRAATILGILLVGSAASMQVACGGSSSSSGSGGNTPPPNLSIGWSAGTGYDLVTGLGTPDVATLLNAWQAQVGNPGSSFSLSEAQVAAPKANPLTPGTYTITLTRSSGFTGTVALTCVATGDVAGDAAPTCSFSAPTLNSGSTTSTLTVTTSSSTVLGPFNVNVRGTSGALSHGVNVPVTVN